jgi:uncharacterized protein (TIGR02001 family)
MLRAGLRTALCISLLLACGIALAQTGVGVAFLSDYLYRGVSLSDGRPTLSLSVAYDNPSGWYGGASLTGVSLGPYHQKQLQELGYAGYAGQLSDRFGWEAGATVVHFTVDPRYDYYEGFVGLSGERWNMRLHVSPDYFGSGTSTAYGELNVGVPLSPITRATAHVGALARAGGASAEGSRTNFDGSVGLAVARDAWEVRLDWVFGGLGAAYPSAYGRATGGTLVLSALLSF